MDKYQRGVLGVDLFVSVDIAEHRRSVIAEHDIHGLSVGSESRAMYDVDSVFIHDLLYAVRVLHDYIHGDHFLNAVVSHTHVIGHDIRRFYIELPRELGDFVICHIAELAYRGDIAVAVEHLLEAVVPLERDIIGAVELYSG